jgi:hypothetical protein
MAAALLETGGNCRALDSRARPLKVISCLGCTMLLAMHDSLLIDRLRNHG